jgi:hypothetical protein
MATAQSIRFEDLKSGDRIRITHRVKVGLRIWNTTTTGTVIRTERIRIGLHVKRSEDDKAFADVIVLSKDGPTPEETTVTLDEFTTIEPA